jgi:hypothetical protein
LLVVGRYESDNPKKGGGGTIANDLTKAAQQEHAIPADIYKVVNSTVNATSIDNVFHRHSIDEVLLVKVIVT